MPFFPFRQFNSVSLSIRTESAHYKQEILNCTANSVNKQHKPFMIFIHLGKNDDLIVSLK